MTGDDIRRLIGSYATGSLSDGERKTLYEAALEDQELFDELAREHAFKDLLTEPGAKQRLIAALSEPKREPAKGRGWRWATAALIAASVVIAIVAVKTGLRPPEKPPVEMARMSSEPQQLPPEPVAAPQFPAPAPKARPKAFAPRAPEKPVAAQKDLRAEQAATTADQLAAQVPKPPPPAQPVAPQPARPQPVTPRMQSAPAGAAGFQGAFRTNLAQAPRFAFDYQVETGGILMIKPAASGYLRIAANSATGTKIIFPADGAGRVAIDSVNRIPIPPGTQELAVTFSAQPSVEAAPGLSVTSENAMGTVEDPNPTVSSKLVLTLRVNY